MRVNKIIPYGRQSIDELDILEINKVLNSDWLTQGPVVTHFEQALSEYCSAAYAVACTNATAALYVACLALGITVNDIVWTSPNTFLSSANCARFCGAQIDFVDIDEKTYNLCPDKLEAKLLTAEKLDKLPKIIIPVHFAGQSCDMKKIHQLAKKFNFHIIEDASHAIGATYLDKRIGCCQYSDITIFSFHPVKIITTGEGGAALTNSKEIAEKIRLYITHGMTRDSKKMENPSNDLWYYEQIELGFNYRITDIHCALGLSQLKKIDTFIRKRHELVARYNEGLKYLPLTLPYQHPDTYSSFHLYVICLMAEYKNKTRAQLFNELRQANIGVNVHYIPVHTQPYYKKFGFQWGDFPVSEDYYHRTITLPLYPGLSYEQQDTIISIIKNILT